eukprot:1137235-Pelagomonas_calceolata.AAC.5
MQTTHNPWQEPPNGADLGCNFQAKVPLLMLCLSNIRYIKVSTILARQPQAFSSCLHNLCQLAQRLTQAACAAKHPAYPTSQTAANITWPSDVRLGDVPAVAAGGHIHLWHVDRPSVVRLGEVSAAAASGYLHTTPMGHEAGRPEAWPFASYLLAKYGVVLPFSRYRRCSQSAVASLLLLKLLFAVGSVHIMPIYIIAALP